MAYSIRLAESGDLIKDGFPSQEAAYQWLDSQVDGGFYGFVIESSERDNRMLIQHIRKGKRLVATLASMPVGVCEVPNLMGNRFNIGFALCNRKAGDKFSKEVGTDIAIGRAIKNPIFAGTITVPQSLSKHVEAFRQRCLRYYKVQPEFRELPPQILSRKFDETYK